MSGSADPNYIYGSYLSRPASTNPELKKLILNIVMISQNFQMEVHFIEVGSNDLVFP